MKKTALGNTGMEISKIFYGGIVSMEDGQEKSDQYVAYAIEKGINYFDVAPSYGDAEEKLGNSLIPYRKDIFLACKTGERLAEGAKRELEQSHKLLHTDYFDVYQMHALASIEDVETAFSKGGVFDVMLKAKEAGEVKHLGITCHSEEAALRALELYPFETVLFPTNWALHLKKGFAGKLAAVAKERGIGFLGMKSMIHRAWKDEAERQVSRFPKSWCMPITDNEELTVAAMKYALETLGATALVPPGNIENFTFAVEHADLLSAPLTAREVQLLEQELTAIGEHFFF